MIVGKIRGIGIDAVAINRMDSQRMTLHVLKRMFSATEVTEALELEGLLRSEYLASRFAAKEAFVKALGTGFRGISPSEISVTVDSVGKPSLVVLQEVKDRLCLDSCSVHLSLTHEKDLAIAFVVLEDFDGSL